MNIRQSVPKEEARYHGAYVCTNCDGHIAPVSRPKAGCSGGRCSDCGEEKEYVEVLRGLEMPDSRSALEGTRKLTKQEVIDYIEEVHQ